MPLNCAAEEDSWESLGLQGDQTSQSYRKSTLNIHWKDWCWSSNTLTTWCKERTHWKDPDAGKDWRQEEKGITEDEMVGWHHWLNGQEFEQTPGNDEGQGSLACCSPWGHKESDITEQLNNNCEMSQALKYFWLYFFFCIIMVFNKGCSFSAVSLFYIFFMIFYIRKITSECKQFFCAILVLKIWSQWLLHLVQFLTYPEPLSGEWSPRCQQKHGKEWMPLCLTGSDSEKAHVQIKHSKPLGL